MPAYSVSGPLDLGGIGIDLIARAERGLLDGILLNNRLNDSMLVNNH